MAVLEDVRAKGWSLVRALSPEGARAAIDKVGRILLETRVVEGGQSGSAAVTLHTDSWRAEVVAWYCHARAEAGGDMVLVDAREALALLDPADLRALAAIRLGVDGAATPLVRDGPGAPALYFVPSEIPEARRRAACVLRFRAALATLSPITFRLARGDLLTIDNTRMLHGRAALEGGPPRELTRWWVVPQAS